MVCTSPITRNGQLDFPCGKCIACKLQRSSEWANRIMHEAQSYKESVFITLTYSDDHLPENGSLSKPDLVKFMKRIRAKLKYSEGRQIKYFGSGEYGTQGTERPHYHAILFGVGYSDFNEVTVNGKTYNTIPQWEYGFIDVKPLIWNRANYTAKYILKKTFEEKQKCIIKNITPPFQISSNGIGLNWAKAHRANR